MKSSKISFPFTAIALAASAAFSLVVACSGDDNNSNPQPNLDSGSDVTTSGDDSSMPGTDSSTTPGDSSTPPSDAPSLDTGSCKSDASTCNSCYSAVQAMTDPYNACSPYTANCVKFDATRVPSHPML